MKNKIIAAVSAFLLVLSMSPVLVSANGLEGKAKASVAGKLNGNFGQGNKYHKNERDEGFKNFNLKQTGMMPMSFTKGTVISNTNGNLTVQTKKGQNIAVVTGSSTQVFQNGTTTAVSNIAVGARVKLGGLWNSVLNIFSAIKIRVF